jgi:hypothetical protein
MNNNTYSQPAHGYASQPEQQASHHQAPPSQQPFAGANMAQQAAPPRTFRRPKDSQGLTQGRPAVFRPQSADNAVTSPPHGNAYGTQPPFGGGRKTDGHYAQQSVQKPALPVTGIPHQHLTVGNTTPPQAHALSPVAPGASAGSIIQKPLQPAVVNNVIPESYFEGRYQSIAASSSSAAASGTSYFVVFSHCQVLPLRTNICCTPRMQLAIIAPRPTLL